MGTILSNDHADDCLSSRAIRRHDRFEDLAKAERVLLTEQGVVPLYQPAEAWMVRPTVKNVVYNGAGANYNFKYAYVEK